MCSLHLKKWFSFKHSERPRKVWIVVQVKLYCPQIGLQSNYRIWTRVFCPTRSWKPIFPTPIVALDRNTSARIPDNNPLKHLLQNIIKRHGPQLVCKIQVSNTLISVQVTAAKLPFSPIMCCVVADNHIHTVFLKPPSAPSQVQKCNTGNIHSLGYSTEIARPTYPHKVSSLATWSHLVASTNALMETAT